MGRPRLKVVIDTSVLIASLWNTRSRSLVELWKEGKITLCASEAILKEYLYILPRFVLFRKGAEKLLSLLKAKNNIKMVRPFRRLKIIKEDPLDNKFLECAIEAKADYIISADKHLRNLGEYEGVKIVSSENFLRNKAFEKAEYRSGSSERNVP